MAEEPTVVVAALTAEYVRVRNKLNGASQRLRHATSQVDIEVGLRDEAKANMDMLADAIISHGGTIPPHEEPTPTVASAQRRDAP